MSQFPWHIAPQHRSSVSRDPRLVHGSMNAAVKMIYRTLLTSDPIPMTYKIGERKFDNAIQFASHSLNCLITWHYDNISKGL